MIELAHMAIVPVCPKCGYHLAMPPVHDHEPTQVLPTVACECGWEGVTRRSAPQPKIVLRAAFDVD